MKQSKRIWTSKQTIPLFMQIVAFGCSSIITVMLCYNLGSSQLSKCLFAGIAIVLESAKYFFFFLGIIGDNNLSKGLQWTYLTIGISCFIVSFVSTLAFGLNEITVEKNDVAKNNTLKVAQIENNTSIDNQVSKLNTQIDKLTDEKTVEVNKWDKFKYSTKRDQIANRYNNDIKEIRDQIKDLNSRRTLPKDQKSEAKTVLGYSILLGNWTVLWMAFISILGEIIGIFSHVEYRRSTRRIQKQYTVWEDNYQDQPKQDIPQINKPAVDLGLFGEKTLQERLEERRKKRDNSNDAKSNALTKSDLKYLEQYKEHMIKSLKKNGKVDGTETASKILGISRDRANMLRQYLIDDGFLRGEGKYTYLNTNQEGKS